jgi:hypothetical protein
MTKLSNDQVREIRRLIKTKTMKQKELTTKYNVSLATINNIINNQAYKDVPEEDIEINKEKPYSCRVSVDCQKAFTSASLRKRHEAFHTKPFKCVKCEKGYASKERKEYCERKHRDEEIENEEAKKLTPDILTLFDLDIKLIDKEYINTIYKKALIRHHPDKGGSNDTFNLIQNNKLELFKLIYADEKTLKDAERKQKYYQQLLKYYSEEQTLLRNKISEKRKEMNNIGRENGTSNELFKQKRKEVYQLEKQLIVKPYESCSLF